MEILLLKLLCAPVLVVASALAGRRWGSSAAGVLVALPIVAGPILFITYLQHGVGFAARSASASLLGLVSLALFAVVFSALAGHFGWLPTLAVSWASVLGADLVLAQLHTPVVVGFGLTVASTLAALRLMPRRPPESIVHDTQRWPWWDLPGRAAATGGLVVAITGASSTLGPQLTGVLAPFPIATSVVAAFVHAQRGPSATSATLAGALTGLFGFATFCCCVAVLVPLMGGAAFALAAALTVAVQAPAVWLRRRPP